MFWKKMREEQKIISVNEELYEKEKVKDESTKKQQVELSEFADTLEDVCKLSLKTNEMIVNGISSMAVVMSKYADKIEKEYTDLEAVKENINGTAKELDTAAKQTSDLSSHIKIRIDETKETFQEAMNVMQTSMSGLVEMIMHLAKQNEELVGTLQGIDNISKQTKLLALNASIEAARAGEAGKGFAVVASEVQNLSMQSEKYTESMRKRISEIQDESTKTEEAFTSKLNDIISANQNTFCMLDEVFQMLAESLNEHADLIVQVGKDSDANTKCLNQITLSLQDCMSEAIQNKDEMDRVCEICIKQTNNVYEAKELAGQVKQICQQVK